MGLACQTQTRADLCCFALRSLLVHHRLIPTITTMADVAPEVVATPEVAEEKAEAPVVEEKAEEAPATNGEAAKEETNGEAKEEAKDEANDAEKRTAEEAEIEPIAVSPEKKAKLEEANETTAETPAEVTA